MHWGTLEHIRTHKWEVLGHTGRDMGTLGTTGLVWVPHWLNVVKVMDKKTVCNVIADIFFFVFVSQRSAIPLAVTSTPPT